VRHIKFQALLLTASTIASTHAAALQETNDLDALFGANVQLATGYDRPERLAPAVVDTITHDEIVAMGAISFDEIMQRAAGVVVQKNRVNDNVYTFRGVYNELNPQVLIMIDGSPISDPVAGGRPIAWNMLASNIDKVEIIRGPGSAVFGADAVTGVVNVITKGAVRTDLSEIGVFGGSFGTIGGHFLQTFNLGSARANLTLHGRRSAGDDDQVALADAQTVSDLFFGTSASNAPNALRTDRSEVATRLNLAAGDNFSAFAAYDGFFNTGAAFASTFQASDFNEFNNHLISGGFKFEKAIGRVRLDTTNRVLWNNLSARTLVAPAGAFSPATFSLAPFDLKNQFDYQSVDARSDLIATFDVRNHTIRVGGGGTYQRGFDIMDYRNFLLSPTGLIPATSPTLVDVRTLGQSPNSDSSERTIFFALAQDEWRLGETLTLTAGLRFDHYNQFGGSVNPRASLVWAPNLNSTFKILYGAAFRAPTFLEFRTNPGSIVAGNPDLKPETSDTIEIEASHKFGALSTISVSAFYFKGTDTIEVVNTPTVSTFQNGLGYEGYGIEATAAISPMKVLSIKGNYSFQNAKSEATGLRLPNSAAHAAFLDFEWRPSTTLQANFIANYVGERTRAFGDPRPALEDYVRADLNIAWRPARFSEIEIGFTAKNLFNSDYDDPTTSFLLAPDDFPREGRSFFGRLQKRF
jgi:iron complex outermembrane receptor protein